MQFAANKCLLFVSFSISPDCMTLAHKVLLQGSVYMQPEWLVARFACCPLGDRTTQTWRARCCC